MSKDDDATTLQQQLTMFYSNLLSSILYHHRVKTWLVSPLGQFLLLPASLCGLAIPIELEIGRVLQARYGLRMEAGPVSVAEEMAARVGSSRPTSTAASTSGSGSSNASSQDSAGSSSPNATLAQQQAAETQQQQLRHQQQLFDAQMGKVNSVLSGVSSM